MSHRYKLTIAPRAETRKFNPVDMDFKQFVDLLSAHTARRDKDGMLFLPGHLIDGKRNVSSVPVINSLVYDIDGTNTVEELNSILEKCDLFSIMYSTYNHGRTVTHVKTDAYDKWAKRSGAKQTPDLESMLDYLKFVKKTHLNNVTFTGETVHKSSGIVYIINHAPEDKVRVVFPLGDKPIVLAELSKLTHQAVDTYKAIYHGVGESLGLRYDEACSDPSRLHYLPCHHVDATNFFVRQFSGSFLDYTNYPRSMRSNSAKVQNLDGTSQKKKPSDYIVYDQANVRIDLLRWDKNNRYDFDIEGMLQSVLPEDMVRSPRSGGKEGIHIQCPFEHEHTEPGGLGTYVVSSDGDKPWTIWCSHNSCQSAGRRRLDYLKALIEEGLVTAEDLEIEAVPVTQETETTPSFESAAQAMGFDSDLLPEGGFEAFTAKLHSLSETVDLTEAVTRLEEALKEARYATHIIDSVTTALDVGVKIDVDMMAKLLVETEADIKSITDFARKAPEDVIGGVSPAEFARIVKDMRADSVNIIKAVGDILTEQVVGTERDAAIKRLAAWYGETFKHVSELYKAQSDSIAKDEHDDLILQHFARMNKRFAKVHSGTSVMFIDMLKSKENGLPRLISKEAMSLKYSNWVVNIYKEDKRTGRTKLTSENVFNVWNTGCRDIKIYDGLTFDPNQGTETADNMFNMWSGFHMKAVPGDATPILDHIKHVWCGSNEDHFNWLQLYIWDIFANPGLKPHSNVVILGGQGTGKSIVFEHALRHMLNPYYVQTPNRSDLTGNFNAIAENKLLFYADEALFSGDKAAAAMLKGKVAQEFLRIERKGVDTYMIPHFTRYFFTSNSEHAIHLDSDDRRYFVLRTSDEYKQREDYFEKLRFWLTKENGCSKWLHHIVNWRPEDYGLQRRDLYRPPQTEAKRGQINQSIDPSSEFFLEIIKNGKVVSVPDAVPMPATLAWPLDSETPFSADTLRNMFEAYLRHVMGNNARFERTKYAELFKKYLGASVSSLTRVSRANGKTMRSLVLPPRRQILEALHSLHIIDDTELDEATAITDAHLPRYDMDDL